LELLTGTKSTFGKCLKEWIEIRRCKMAEGVSLRGEGKI